MERENNQEKVRPLKDNCNSCKKNYRLTMDNAYVVHYDKKPECDHMMCKCPRCDFVTMIFLSPNGDTMERAKENLISINKLDWPSEKIYSTWLRLMGIELVEPNELTQRQERIVEYLGNLLEKDLLTIEDFNKEGEVYL